ncbi:MAG: hypothetical protein GWP33_03875 [Alphaproteobacteria bacterium]|nr:hypothetical protein [Alphaproteobacteria bacterium]
MMKNKKKSLELYKYSLVKFQQLKKFVFDNFGVFALLVGGVILISPFIGYDEPWLYNVTCDEDVKCAGEWTGASTRSLIFALGAVGAIYGLILSARTLEKFSHQVETSEKNLFNDRLSRAVEALGHKKIAVRNSGLWLLHNLGNETPQNSDDRQIIVDILHGYIRDRAVMPSRDEDGNLLNALSSKERTDIKLAIKILFDHVPSDSRREYPLDRLDLRDLDLSEFDLQNVDMFNANLEGTFLISANLEGALFYKANLRNAYLWGAELKKADLSNAELQGGAFASSKLQDTNFQNSKLQGAFFNGVRLQGTNLQNAELQNVDLSYADLQGVKNMKQEQLNECVYSKNHQPKNLPAGLKLPSSRAFEYTEEKNKHGTHRRRIIESGEVLPFFPYPHLFQRI